MDIIPYTFGFLYRLFFIGFLFTVLSGQNPTSIVYLKNGKEIIGKIYTTVGKHLILVKDDGSTETIMYDLIDYVLSDQALPQMASRLSTKSTEFQETVKPVIRFTAWPNVVYPGKKAKFIWESSNLKGNRVKLIYHVLYKGSTLGPFDISTITLSQKVYNWNVPRHLAGENIKLEIQDLSDPNINFVIYVEVAGEKSQQTYLGSKDKSYDQPVRNKENIYSQPEISIVLGMNMASIAWNNIEIDNYFESEPIGFFIIGAEFPLYSGSDKMHYLGMTYTQRGMKTMNDNLNGSELTLKMDYLTAYWLYPFNSRNSNTRYTFGAEVGQYLAGGNAIAENQGNSEEIVIEKENINTDYGLLFGMEYWLGQLLGIRYTYYLGLANIDRVHDADLTGKHTGSQINIVLKVM